MWKFLAVAAVSFLTSFPQARMVVHTGAEGTPNRVALSQEAMQQIVGGLGTASIDIPFPENFAKSDLASHAAKWNQAGNRCQYDCSSVGPSNVGFQIGSYIFVANTMTTPVLELYSDGKGRAKTTANFVMSAGSYNAYYASLITKCIGGSQNGQFCTSDSFCTGGRCAACDHNNVCSNAPSQLAPCTPVCVGGSNAGAICTAQSECPSGDCVSPIEGTADTCYLLSRCGSGSGDACIHDCTTNGVTDNTDSTDAFKSGPFHSAMVRVTSIPPGGSNFEISREDDIYRVAKKNGAGTNCSGPSE